MNTPVVTDVFKFLAIRAAQLVTEKETARTFVRDPRAATAAGRRELKVLARTLAQPSDVALETWHRLDLSLIAPLAEGYRELTRQYERVSPGEDVPPAVTLMAAAGLANVGDGGSTLMYAWEALYTAHATGPGAGPFLETPMAALRVLHFAQTLQDDPRPSPSAALEALRATVVIPAVFDDAFHPPSPAPTVSPPNAGNDSPSSTETSVRGRQLRTLALDLNITGRLFESVTSPSVLASPVARQGALEPSTGSSGRFTLTTVPLLSDALPGRLSSDEAAVLDQLRLVDTTPVPVAAQTLQAHLQKLDDQASVLADDPEFFKVMNDVARAINPLLPPLVTIIPPETAPDVDVSGRITPLGIGDLKVVKQTLLAYVAGEVAHIENVLKGESKERTHRNLDRTETTIFTSQEETKDTERDTQSTDRFELKREAENSLKEDMSVKAGLTVTGSYGPVVATATGDFAYSTSKQESEKNSSNFAREVVDRSVTKVQTKTKTERTTKTLNEVEEINKHSLNNGPPSSGHITGIYRWVDKHYRAQVYNYGVRLLLEFIIPEPAAFYRATHMGTAPKVDGKPPAPFVTDPSPFLPSRPLTAEAITEFNYRRYAARYGAAGVLPPPPQFTYIGMALAPKDGLGDGQSFSIASKDFVVPAGYKLNSYSVAASILFASAPNFNLQVSGDVYELQHSPGGGIPIQMEQRGDVIGIKNTLISGPVAIIVPISVVCYDVYAFAVDIQGVCLRTTETLATWQLTTFGQIQTAYQALQTAYDQKVTQAESAAGITITGQNPAANRIVEKTELKKLCITMMTGQHFKQFGAVTEPPEDPAHPPEVDVFKTLYQGPIIQFFEQAFEWEQMTYLYYPYFWGRKKNWAKAVNLSDPDPLFQQFLTAGAARVVVPVPIAYVDDVLFLLQNPFKETELRRKVWRGGERPIIGSPLYDSIADELRNQTDDLAGAKPEGEPWEFTLPTTLVWLQPDDKLPIFE